MYLLQGAQTLTPSSPLCHVMCSDQSRYTICACIKSSLVEVNDNLLDNPQLLTTKVCCLSALCNNVNN